MFLNSSYRRDFSHYYASVGQVFQLKIKAYLELFTLLQKKAHVKLHYCSK